MEEESGRAFWIAAALPINAVRAAYVEHPTVVWLDRRKLTRHKRDNLSVGAKRLTQTLRRCPPGRILEYTRPWQNAQRGDLPPAQRAMVLSKARARTREALTMNTFSFVICAATLFWPVAASAQLNVLISGGFSGAYEQLLPEFERPSGTKVTTGSGASQGTGPQTIAAQLARGVPAHG